MITTRSSIDSSYWLFEYTGNEICIQQKKKLLNCVFVPLKLFFLSWHNPSLVLNVINFLIDQNNIYSSGTRLYILPGKG
jgi:hypothetical protein